MTKQLYHCSFEIHGHVQGVHFRRCTERKSKELGLRGWVMNTEQGTVKGEIQGNAEQLQQMKRWLQINGSPRSRIDKASFSDLRKISKFHFDNFTIRKHPPINLTNMNSS
ncbi:acylphosphatase-2-like [Scaptodrosophila lebanonensis]|uniref:Acylphosphatase n=1 Tax=Drosophila lebanonensis TaxID=7225 RepID=A0A6J2TE49_DROLE|nr:acylphosphatase-2-like [Scaptodrosophila lebanonensis]